MRTTTKSIKYIIIKTTSKKPNHLNTTLYLNAAIFFIYSVLIVKLHSFDKTSNKNQRMKEYKEWTEYVGMVCVVPFWLPHHSIQHNISRYFLVAAAFHVIVYASYIFKFIPNSNPNSRSPNCSEQNKNNKKIVEANQLENNIKPTVIGTTPLLCKT